MPTEDPTVDNNEVEIAGTQVEGAEPSSSETEVEAPDASLERAIQLLQTKKEALQERVHQQMQVAERESGLSEAGIERVQERMQLPQLINALQEKWQQFSARLADYLSGDKAKEQSAESSMEQRVDYLLAIYERFEKMEGIDQGIMDTVVLLNASGLPTIMSCEGHLERATGGPYIMLSPPAPRDSAVLRHYPSAKERFESEMTGIQDHLEELLDEFYADHNAEADVRLGMRRGSDFLRLESEALIEGKKEDLSERETFLKRSQAEMAAFTGFLRKKFLKEGEVRDLDTIFKQRGYPEDALYEQSPEYGSEFKERIAAMENFQPTNDLHQDIIQLSKIYHFHPQVIKKLESGQIDPIEFIIRNYNQDSQSIKSLTEQGRFGEMNAYWKLVIPKVLESTDRILTFHGISARTVGEYRESQRS